jgi:hypothetical protein
MPAQQWACSRVIRRSSVDRWPHQSETSGVMEAFVSLSRDPSQVPGALRALP